MSEALKGLYARRDALQARIGDRIVSLSRLGSAMVAAADDAAELAILDLESKLQAVLTQITAYERHSLRDQV